LCRHDLFNIRYQFAVFEEASHQRQQYRLHDSLPNRTDDLDAPPFSLLHRKTYRGPSVKALFPKQDNSGALDRRVLVSLEVPGLPEVSLHTVTQTPLPRTWNVVLRHLVASTTRDDWNAPIMTISLSFALAALTWFRVTLRKKLVRPN
jgi:hypothetical protein